MRNKEPEEVEKFLQMLDEKRDAFTAGSSPKKLTDMHGAYVDAINAYKGVVDYARIPRGRNYNSYMSDAQDKFNDAVTTFETLIPEEYLDN